VPSPGRAHALTVAVTVAVAALLAVGGAACTGGDNPVVATTPPSSAGSLLPSSPDALPSFDPPTFDRLLAQLRGKPVVVNVWGSWCGPCIAEAPVLSRLARQTRGRVQFVGVDIIDQRAPAVAFIHRYGWIYPSVFDPSGDIRDALGLVGQPATVLFDASGKRVWQWSGPVDEEVLRTELRTVHAI
jgi:cytochrome c biogenesis protein CcmG/thiol:disulfide interchange protein DsbE